MTKDYRSGWLRLAARLIDAVGVALFFWIRPRPAILPAGATVLVLKFDRIGDTFLATAAVEALRRIFSTQRLVFLAAPWNRAVLEGNPHIDELRVFSAAPDVHRRARGAFLMPRTVRALCHEIREVRPAAAIDLQGNPLIVLAMWLARVRLRSGSGRKVLSFLLHQRARYPDSAHQSELYVSVARQLGYEGPQPQCRMFPARPHLARAQRLAVQHDLKSAVFFHLGAGRSYRQWPLASFVDLARRLLADSPACRIVLIGGPEDGGLGRVFQEQVDDSRVIDWIGVVSLPEFYAAVGDAAGFVGSESAPGHLAAATGVPTIFLMNAWSGTHRWKVIGQRVRTLHADGHRCQGLACSQRPCPNMAAITVESVCEALARVSGAATVGVRQG